MRKRDVKALVNNKSRSYWQNLIYEWVHDELDRKILTMFLLDGWTFEMIAGELNADYKGIYVRYKKSLNQLLKHIEL